MKRYYKNIFSMFSISPFCLLLFYLILGCTVVHLLCFVYFVSRVCDLTSSNCSVLYCHLLEILPEKWKVFGMYNFPMCLFSLAKCFLQNEKIELLLEYFDEERWSVYSSILIDTVNVRKRRDTQWQNNEEERKKWWRKQEGIQTVRRWNECKKENDVNDIKIKKKPYFTLLWTGNVSFISFWQSFLLRYVFCNFRCRCRVDSLLNFCYLNAKKIV